MQEFKIKFQPFDNQIIQIQDKINVNLLKPEKLICNPGRVDTLLDLSLKNPIKSKKLNEIIAKKALKLGIEPFQLKLLIIVDDHTRSTPVRMIAPLLLVYFRGCGITPEKISFLIAGGSHRNMNDDELTRKFGNKLLKNFEFTQSKWSNAEEMAHFGKTDSGLDVYADKKIKNSDIVIGIGNIVPHEIAGFSGGYKLLIPGTSTLETVEKIHWMSTEIPIEKRLGIYDNPIRNEINEAGKLIGLDYIINTVIDYEKNVIGIYSGDPIHAHSEGCLFSKEIYSAKSEPTDIIITDTYPEKTSFWTSCKAILHTKEFVKKGGIMIVNAACPDGISPTHPQIIEMGYHSPEYLKENFLSKIDSEGKHIYNKLTATHCANIWEIKEHCDIYLVTKGITQEETEKLGLKYFNNLQDAYKDALKKFPNIKSINLIENGSEIMQRR